MTDITIHHENRQTLNLNGWLIIDGFDESRLTEIASSLGTPIAPYPGLPLITELMPKCSDQAKSRSLSKTYGLGKIPYHSDGAYMKRPPRYVLLYYKQLAPSSSRTHLLDLQPKLNESTTGELSRAICRIHTGVAIFHSSVISEFNGGQLVRYNNSIMEPVTFEFAVIMQRFQKELEEMDPIIPEVAQGSLLVIDNWRMLHGRSAEPLKAMRMLKRIFIDEAQS